MCMIGQVEIPRVMLHARTLGFTHPVTGNVEDFTRSAPNDMEQVMRALEQFLIPGGRSHVDRSPTGTLPRMHADY